MFAMGAVDKYASDYLQLHTKTDWKICSIKYAFRTHSEFYDQLKTNIFVPVPV